MTKKNYTEIIGVIDRSGSMSSCWHDTVGGINEYIKKQREVPGEAKISLVFFDTEYAMAYNGVDLQDDIFSKPMSFADYSPRGSTALLDAIGKTINTVGNRLAATPEDERPDKVTMFIVTDGEENASREFTGAQIKEMITHQTDKYQWDFVYLGANQDAFAVGMTLGVNPHSCTTYDTKCSAQAFAAVGIRSRSYRTDANIAPISETYQSLVDNE